MDRIPELSVVIPTCDALVWLPDAIASVGADPRAEIIVVDDGSTDGTLAWLGELAVRDKRVRFLHGARGGPSRARNLAISAARAPLIAFLDADDRWLPGKLDAQLALHRAHPEVCFSFTDYRHVTVSGEDRGGCFAFWPRFAAICESAQCETHGAAFLLDKPVAALFAENVVGTSTVVVRADLLHRVGGFRETLRSAEDWNLWLTLATLAPVGVVPTILADYLMHRPGNMTGKMDLRVVAMRMVAERHRAAAIAQDKSVLRFFDARMSAARAEIAEATGHRLSAVALRLRALVHQPTRRAAIEVLAALRGQVGSR